MKEASEYSSTESYSVGDYCIYRGFVYVCTEAVDSEPFDNSKWELIIKNGFYDAKMESASAYDRLYSPTDLSDMFSGLIVDGVFFNQAGMFCTYKDPNAPRRVITKPGRAWFNGIYVNNDNTISFTIPENSGLSDVIHAVVIEINFTDRRSYVKMINNVGTDINLYVDGADEKLVKRYLIAKIISKANRDVINKGDIWNAVGFETRFFAFILEGFTITDLYNKYKSQYDTYINKFEQWFSRVNSMIGYGDDAYEHLHDSIIDMLKNNPYIDRLLPRIDQYITEFTGDGEHTTFTVGDIDIALSNAVDIIISSARVDDEKFDYTINDHSVTFNNPPANGTTIKVRWIPVYDDSVTPDFAYSLYFSEPTT